MLCSLTQQRDCSSSARPLCRRMSHLEKGIVNSLGGIYKDNSSRKVALFWQDVLRRTFLKGWCINSSAEHQLSW